MGVIRSICRTAVAIIFLGCWSGTLDTAAPGAPLNVTRLRPEPYSFNYNSGFFDPERLVIRDQAAWEAAWQKTFQRFGSVPPLPAVDFTREMVLLAALGGRNSGGYTILIDGASATDTEATVTVRSISPGQTCGTTAALTQPVDIARLPRRADVRFVERSEVQQCN